MTEKHAKFFNREKNIHLILFAVVVFSVVVFLLHGNWTGSNSGSSTSYEGYTEPSWVYQKGSETIDSDLLPPDFYKMEKGQPYSISTVLTYDGSRIPAPYCFFFVDHMFCRVTLDNEEIFSYMPEDIHKLDHSKSPGNVYVAAPLPHDCAGKELKIEFIPALDEAIEYGLPSPYFGDYKSTLRSLFWFDLPNNLMIVFATILGLVLILCATLLLTGSDYRKNMLLGIFSMLFGLYNITESDFIFYMISNPYFTYMLDYVTFTTFPIFFMAFLREHMESWQKKCSTAIIAICTLLFITEITLHVTGLFDMRETLKVTHVVYFLFSAASVGLLFVNKEKRQYRLIIPMIPVMLGLVLDILVYYVHLSLGTSDLTFTATGVLFFIICEVIHILRSNIGAYIQSEKSQIYQEMAFRDYMTDTGNYRAFSDEKASVSANKGFLSSVTVISADLNNLKAVNDSIGHAAGDELICSAADLLKELASGYGKVFRTGGDEFAVILYDISDEELDSRLQNLSISIDEFNKTSQFTLSIALGTEKCKQCTDIDTIVKNADAKMYADKAKYKIK